MFTPEQTKILNELAHNPHLARHTLEHVPRPAIRELSTQVQVEVEQLHEEINILQARLEELRILKDTRSMQHDLLDQTYLSDEILLQIFGHCFDHIAIPFKRADAPWSLTWTCSRWRDIVLNRPLFWHDVRGTIRKRGKHNITDVVHEVFRRSRRCPVSLSISGTVQKVGWGDVKRFIRPLLMGSPTKISALTIDIPPQFLNWDCFLSIYLTQEAYRDNLWNRDIPSFKLSTFYPNLVELTIQNWSYGDSGTVRILETLVEGRLPYLDHLELSTPECHDNPRFLFREHSVYSNAINWTNLSTLILRDYIVMPWPRVQTLLRGCDRLISLEIVIGPSSGYLNENPTSTSSRRIRLSSLKVFKADLYGHNPEMTSTFMHELLVLLDFPVITWLELTSQFGVSLRTSEALPNNVANHIFTLKTLKALQLPISAGALSRAAIDAIASGEWGSSIQDLTCTIAATDMEAFLDMLTAHWSRPNNGPIAMQNNHKDNLRACIRRVHVYIIGGASLAWKYGDICDDLKKKMGLDDSYLARFGTVR